MTCDLNPTTDQRQVLDAIKSLLDARYPVSRLREPAPDDLGALAGFGAIALALPEALGGAGFTVVEEALVHVALGRHLLSTRTIAAPVGARIAGSLGRADLARSIAAGETGVCAALRDREGYCLVDAGRADLAVVFGDDGLELVEPDGAAGEPVAGLGHDLALTRCRARDAASLGASNGGPLLLSTDLLVSAQLLGVAGATRDLAISHAEIRHQFGRPIGSFQAIKHRAADMAIRTEMLSAQLDMASIALRDDREDAAFQVAALRRLAPRAALENARACIQIHGGIGFSAEADAHHYLKKAHLLRQIGGFVDMLVPRAPLGPHRARDVDLESAATGR